MLPMLFLTRTTWSKPSTDTVLVCIAAFVMLVAIGHFLWKARAFRGISVIMFLAAIPWGFALALYVLDITGLESPYTQDERAYVQTDDHRGGRMEPQSIESTPTP